MEIRSSAWLAYRLEVWSSRILDDDGILLWIEQSYNVALRMVCSGMGKRNMHGISGSGQGIILGHSAILFKVLLAAAREIMIVVGKSEFMSQ